MTIFEYASGLISIVVGLAIARVLGGIGAFLTLNQRTAHDWIVAVWCMALSLNLVMWWIVGWRFLQNLAEISVATLMFWTSATALLYLAAYILVPGSAEGHSGHDARTNFKLPGLAFFGCLAAHFAMFAAYQVSGAV